MKKTENQHQIKIALLVEKAQKSGLFSHAHVLAGRNIDQTWQTLEVMTHPGLQASFDLASMTKALVTTPVVVNLLESLKLKIAAPLGEWSPRVNDALPHLASISTLALLQHRSGLPSWRNFWVNHLNVADTPTLLAERHSHMTTCLRRISVDLSQKGQFNYSCVGFILLCLACEWAHNKRFDEIFDDFVRVKLGDVAPPWDTLRFGKPGNQIAHAVPTSFCQVRGRELVGEVHDENAAALGGISGNSGIFGTARQVFDFLRNLIATEFGGKLLAANGKFLDVSEDPLCGWRRGNGPSAAGIYDGLAMGHTGFTGTVFWVEPCGRGLGIVLTNRVISGRTSSISAIQDFRREVFAEIKLWDVAMNKGR